jgi:outer membrane protein TolC
MKRLFIGSGFSLFVIFASAQRPQQDTLANATLQACVQYALKHYPLVQQALLDEQITERQIKSKLADWYPQLNFNASYTNYFQLPAVAFNGTTTRSGNYNVSQIGFQASQNIFTRDVLLASKTKGDVMTNIRQATVSNKIDVAVNVSKAFYDVLLTEKTIEVLVDDIVRLERNLKDTYNQYRGGLVDKTDYKRATITLNNSRAEKKSNEEALKAKYATLKQLMGYTAPDSLRLVYDSAQMESEVNIDTLTAIDYSKRIEYQQLMTQKRLQLADVKYQKWAYIPTVSANAAYNMNYLNSRFSRLYGDNFPSSYGGITVAFPIFQGTKRTQEIRMAELQLTRLDWDVTNLQTSISTQYAEALAAYKSNLNNYHILKDNLDLARDVFNTIELQYRSGVKAYLELITAETDLRTAQTNYSNALYLVLSSKLDVQKALGTITY